MTSFLLGVNNYYSSIYIVAIVKNQQNKKLTSIPQYMSPPKVKSSEDILLVHSTNNTARKSMSALRDI